MLSPKQQEFIRHSIAKINIAHGAIRSGKTYASLLRFAELVIDCPDNKIIMIGNSFSTIKENAVKFLTDELFKGYCIWKPGTQKLIFGNKEIRVIGANDEGSVRAIQGNTHSLAYVDELTTIPYNFVDMLTTRLSHDWSKLVATCNPNSPVHPVKTNLVGNKDPSYCYSLHFEIDDNPHLSENTKRDLKTQYTGLFYKRYILGQWISAEGSIYSDFSRETHVVDREPGAAQRYFVGVDYGMQNAFVAVMLGTRNDHSPHMWVKKEFVWDPKKMYRQKTNSELADHLEQFCEGHNVRGIYLDPSAESFEVELKRRKMRVIQADNDVYPGITFVANLISNHELKVTKDCPTLIGELEMYTWDPKKALRGIEEPIKANDHSVDALRYVVFSVFGKRHKLNFDPPPQDGGRTLGRGQFS
jgi:PBSX family phage terminase large subunit